MIFIFEPETPAVQGQYSTTELQAQRLWIRFVKIIKEVIQLQVPLQLPCDDLTHLAGLRFGLTKKLTLT